MRVLAGTLRGGVILACLLLAAGLLTDERLLRAGLFVLVLTPLARLLMLTRVFVLEHDRTFAAISIGVLLLVIASVLLAL